MELPEKYQCNGFTHSHFTAQLQESEDWVGQIFSTEKQETCQIRRDLGCKKCASIVFMVLEFSLSVLTPPWACLLYWHVPRGGYSRDFRFAREILDSHRHNSSLEAGQLAFSPQDL